jgi:DNA-binding XRE family transcriptional regulator
MSQVELARKLEINKTRLSAIESGHNKPSLRLIEKYSQIFGIPVSSILLFSESVENKTKASDIVFKCGEKVIKILEWVEDIEQKG